MTITPLQRKAHRRGGPITVAPATDTAAATTDAAYHAFAAIGDGVAAAFSDGAAAPSVARRSVGGSRSASLAETNVQSLLLLWLLLRLLLLLLSLLGQD